MLVSKASSSAAGVKEQPGRRTLTVRPAEVPWVASGILAVVLGLQAVVTLILTSQLTDVGEQVYRTLGGARERASQVAGLTGVALAVFYFADMQHSGDHRVPAVVLLACMFAATALCFTTEWPSLPIMLCLAGHFATVVMLRHRAFTEAPVQDFSLAVALVFALLGSVVMIVWVLWAFTPLLGGYHKPWAAREQARLEARGFSPNTTYVLWSSPAFCAYSYLSMGFAALLRSRVHLPQDGSGEAIDLRSARFITGELRMAGLCLITACLTLWVAVDLHCQDLGLSEAIRRMGAFLLASAATYLLAVIGPVRIMRAAEQSPALQAILEVTRSDWVKAAGLMLTWPALPVYFAVELLHQRIRARCGRSVYLTAEARMAWGWIESLNWTSVLTKSIRCGVLFFGLQVLVTQYTTIFLVWINDTIASWSMASMLCTLFAVGLFMFLMPPVPGVPVYVLAGNLITQKCYESGRSFSTACILSVCFSFMVKLCGSFMQQKGIGEPLSHNVSVKVFICVQTAPMKAVRHILKKPGVRLDKAAVLVGGPDWPISVLCGILRLNVVDILIGSTPVLFVVAPFALAAAFQTQVQHVADEDKKRIFFYVGSILTAFSPIVLLFATAAAGYFIQSTVEEHQEEIDTTSWEADEQEAEVLLVADQYNQVELARKRKEAWETLTCLPRLLIMTGSIAASVSAHLVLWPMPGGPPFKSFTLKSKISDLPGGSTLSLINPLGWLIIGIVVVCIFIDVGFQVAMCCKGKKTEVDVEGQEGECDALLKTR